MPVRFRRTFKIFPGVRINVNKGSISTTVGIRGLNLTFNRHGVRRTIGLPGSGLSETSYLIRYDKDKDDDDDKDNGRRSRASATADDRRDSADERERPRDADPTPDRNRRDDDDDGPEMGCFPWGCIGFVLVVLVLGFFIGSALNVIPPNYLSQLMVQVTQAIRDAGF